MRPAERCDSALTLLLLVTAAPARATSLDLTYTVFGVGGESAPLASVSDTNFWWIDSTGTQAASALTAYGYAPFPAFDYIVDTLGRGDGGSLLLSSEFDLAAGETLSVDFRMLSGFSYWFDGTAPTGMVLLVGADQAPIVLARVNADGTAYFANQNFQPVVTAAAGTFGPISDDATMTVAPRVSGLDVTLNGTEYAGHDITGLCGCALDVSTTATPGAGTYQLLFALYDYETGRDFYHAALAVTDVQTTPEPGTWALLALGVGGAVMRQRRRHGVP